MPNLKINRIFDPGNKDEEVVQLIASADVNLGHYMITDNTYDSSGGASNKWRHSFHFPSVTVKNGDLVQLWTKPGKDQVTDHEKDNRKYKTHHFHMGLKTSVWNASGDIARLFYLEQTQAVKK